MIGPEVELGERCHLLSHVAMDGPTRIGADNRFFPFCSIGLAPQDISYKGEPTRLEIGDHNEIREYVTINRATAKADGVTRVGSHNLIMAYTHIAHDCRIGNHIIMANAATLGGHVTVEDWATVGALCPVHHFVRIGTHAFIGGGTTDHARRAAVFKNFSRAWNARLRIECRRPRAAWICEGADQENSSCVPRAAGFEAEYVAGAGEAES